VLEKPLVTALVTAFHTRRSHVQRSRDGLLSVCHQCARGAEVINSDAGEAIETVVSRAPVSEGHSPAALWRARHCTRADADGDSDASPTAWNGAYLRIRRHVELM
jgi:hypothetical protein